jgi:hypothetical protein
MTLESDKTIARLLADPSLSYWLRGALRTAAARDPLDALNDAEALCQVLTERAREVLALEERGGDVQEG